MRFLSRLFFLSLLITCFLLLATHSAYAEGEFKTDYKVAYVIDKNGLASISQDITMENKTPNFYADKFELKIGSTKVTDVKARDETGDLETDVKFENNITVISVKFKQRVIGAGKKLSWHLSYTSTELASKSGQIWEISIPKVAKSQDTNSYEAKVTVPKTFGPVAFAIPKPLTFEQNTKGQEFNFNKEQLFTSGISMSFGDKQVFSFKLNYFLQNPSLTSQISEISIPPDNNYQKIVLGSIEPKPMDVYVDEDGNFLAKYKLSPKQKINISVEGKVEVFSKPFRKIIQKLDSAQREKYTQPQQYWETDDPIIGEKANELKTADKIYEFVANYLSYNTERLKTTKVERKGAVSAYNKPKDAVCMEFTDLFIAIARAAKIPAREIQGYAYTQNERLRPLSLNLYNNDVLHAWPEYWDENLGWVQIDPTWGSTSGGLDYFNKLDFNHITFIQRGLFSKQPYPAGAYKEEGKQNEKTVYVSFSSDLPKPINSSELKVDLSDTAYALFPIKMKVNLLNTGSTSIIGEKMTFSGNGRLKNNSQNPIEIPILPPYASKKYVYNLETNNMLSQFTEPLIVSYASSQISKTVKVEPFYKVVLEPTFLLALFISGIIITFGLFLHKKTQKKIHIHKHH